MIVKYIIKWIIDSPGSKPGALRVRCGGLKCTEFIGFEIPKSRIQERTHCP